MAGIVTQVNKKTLVQLEYTETAPGGAVSNVIEPTVSMIDAVITMHRARKTPLEIKRTVKSSSGKKLTYGQINEVRKAMDDRIADLKPTEP